MATTDNGWPASPSLPIRPFVIGGVAFVPGLADNDDVHTVLGYVLTQFHERVEPLHAGWCWGFAYRANVNSPNSLSRHSGGIAVDANAPAHPNGVPTTHTFSAKQIDEVHRILDEVDGAVRWGGDYHGNPDAMHFEINVSPSELPRIAGRVRDMEEVVTLEDRVEIAKAVLAQKFVINRGQKNEREVSVEQALRETLQRAAKDDPDDDPRNDR